MSQVPYPFETTLQSGITLRGLEYAQDGPPVVLVHDLGGDADSWREIPSSLVSGGFRAINLELPGHGLSDDGESPESTFSDLMEALTVISGSFGPLGIVTYGTVATHFFGLGREHGVPVQVLVSPLPSDMLDPVPRIPAMRAIFAGTKDDEADQFVRSNYQQLAGQNMWFSTGTSERGVDLLASKPHMIEQMITFLRRYLVGFHLAWISEQTEGDRGHETG